VIAEVEQHASCLRNRTARHEQESKIVHQVREKEVANRGFSEFICNVTHRQVPKSKRIGLERLDEGLSLRGGHQGQRIHVARGGIGARGNPAMEVSRWKERIKIREEQVALIEFGVPPMRDVARGVEEDDGA